MVVGITLEPETDRVFRALANPTRRDIIHRVLRQGESVSSLARRYDMSFAAVQKHVAVLERAALVTKTRSGREQIVLGHEPTLRKTTELFDAYEQIWAQRATQIAEIIGEKG